MRAERGEVWQIDFGMAAKVRPALLLTGGSLRTTNSIFSRCYCTRRRCVAIAGNSSLQNRF
jgi:hypothetical protein